MARSQSEILEQTAELLRSDQKEEAQELLGRFLKENPNSVRGWWIMSYAVSDLDQQITCLQRVLNLSPNHSKAQARLDRLSQKTEKSEPSTPTSKSKNFQNLHLSLSKPAIAILIVFGCLGFLALGYFGYQIFFPANNSVPTQAEIAQDSQTSSIVMGKTATPAWTVTPTAFETAIPTDISTEATRTPLISVTPTINQNATATNVPEGQIGTAAGQFPPDFTLINAVTNAEVNLREFVGQPVLIVFLNTLAKECEPEMPGLQAVYEKYQDQGLVVLGVGVGSSQSALRTYTGRFGGLSFPLLSDWEHEIAKDYNVSNLPTNIFVRKNGKIWQVSYGAMTEAEIEAVIASVLKVP